MERREEGRGGRIAAHLRERSERKCRRTHARARERVSQPTRLHSTQVKQQQKAPSPSCHDNPDLSSCSPVPIKTLRPSIISMAREQSESEAERTEMEFKAACGF